MIKEIHSFIESYLPDLKDLRTNRLEKQYLTKLDIYVPINYGTVSYRKDKATNIRRLSWKPPKTDYIPNWDIGNVALIWLKVLDDILKDKGILPNDTISYIKGASYEFHQVDHIDDRKLVYHLIPYEDILSPPSKSL